jgi:hypothetical protein
MKVYKLEITGGAYGEEKEEVTVKAESPEVAIKLGLADLRREVIEIAKLTDTVYGVFTHIDETGLEVDVTEIGEEKGEARLRYEVAEGLKRYAEILRQISALQSELLKVSAEVAATQDQLFEVLEAK